MHPAETAFEAAKADREAAYYNAYVYPAPGWYVDVSGYDRDVVLRMAESERELHCPKW